MVKAAIIGALTISAALLLQDYLKGDSANVIRLMGRAFMGALIGIGVAKFLSRKKQHP